MNKNPPHPGDYVWSAIIQPRGITVRAAADVLGVSHIALSSLINRHSALSPLMALRLEKAFGEDMETLLFMQAVWDAAKVRKTAKDLRVPKFKPSNVIMERVGARGAQTMRVKTPGERMGSSS
jgi:antitoxin HigA-1